MRSHHKLAFKLIATGTLFLVVALVSIALTLWVSWQLEGGAAAVNEAGRMRMMTYRLALDAQRGHVAALPAQAQTMDATLELLRTGDPSRPLFIPWNGQAREEFAQVAQTWPLLRDRWLAARAPVAPAEVAEFVARIDSLVSVIEQELSRWTAVLRGFQFAMVALAIACAVVMLYASYLMVLEPLHRLGSGLAAIRSGDFSARVQVESQDEFGELSAGFNAMAERLQALYGDLEAKVAEKTARLETKREHLLALYEISAYVAQAETMDELARGLASRVRRVARADAVAIRWSDEANQRYLMLAQEGLPASIADVEQCLPAGDCHCGQAAPDAGTRVIPIRPDREEDQGCARAGFATLLTVPVAVQHRVLGEIDLFYRSQRRLDDEERWLIDTVAGHLAGGIETLRAVAAEKEAAVAGERALIAQELHDSIAQSLAFLKIQVGLLREALKRGDRAATEHSIAEIDTGVRESYGDVRELLTHFRTRTNSEDIEVALRTTLQKFEHQTGLRTELAMQGHGVPLPADDQVQVLHVLQEALSNVRKHAGASAVRLAVQQAPQWRFEVSDDGHGFDPAIDAGQNHVGLRIMRERAARIGAQVQVSSAPGQGTRVVLTVPSQAKENPNELADTAAGG